MSADILAKLKIKNMPATKEKIEIALPVPNKKATVVLKTNIVDKSSYSNFDRETFLQQILERTPEEKAIPPVIVAELIKSPVAEPSIILNPKGKPKPKPKPKLKIVEEVIDPVVALEINKETKKKPEEEETQPETVVLIKKPVKRKPLVYEGPLSMVKIGNALITDRIKPKESSIIISASSYYMNNREIFTNFMASLFGKYKQDLLSGKLIQCQE